MYHRHLLLVGSLILSISATANAEEGRFQLERSGDSFLRLDTETGDMSICQLLNKQLVCRAAAEERAAFQQEIDRLDKTIDDLRMRITRLEDNDRRLPNELPSDEEIERTLGFMEKFIRRFMGIIEERESDLQKENNDLPDRT